MKSKRRSWAQVALVALAFLIIGVLLGGRSAWMPSWLRSAATGESASQRQIDSVISLIEKDYYRPVSGQRLADSSLQAAVASLKDPYSHYFPPTQQQAFQAETNPQVSGVGIEVSPSRKGLFVDQVFAGGPAAGQKISVGSVITAVNHRSIKGMNWRKASDLVRGHSGTKVTLTVVHGKHTRTVTVVREEVSEPVVDSEIISYHHHKLGHIIFAQFTQGSAAELREEVRKLQHKGVQGLILDLRDNPGGLLNEAVGVASVFIKDGTIVSTRGRDQPTQVYTAEKNAVAPSIPLVAVVNRGTASSGEIVTAALQQRGRAKIVGTRTYGKGVYQESQTLPGGGILDITVGEFFTPNGHNLGGAGVAQGRDLVRGPGIRPDYYVADNPRDPGPAALKKAETVLAGELG